MVGVGRRVAVRGSVVALTAVAGRRDGARLGRVCPVVRTRLLRTTGGSALGRRGLSGMGHTRAVLVRQLIAGRRLFRLLAGGLFRLPAGGLLLPRHAGRRVLVGRVLFRLCWRIVMHGCLREVLVPVRIPEGAGDSAGRQPGIRVYWLVGARAAPPAVVPPSGAAVQSGTFAVAGRWWRVLRRGYRTCQRCTEMVSNCSVIY